MARRDTTRRKSADKHPATILLAEDNADDVLLMKLAFKKAGLNNPIHVVTSGMDAIEYLKGAVDAKSSGCPAPLLISLDIDMPLANGFEVLNWIRSQPRLDEVPVVVVSGQSPPGKNANRAVQLGARSYLVKPSSFEGLVQMMKTFKTLLDQVERSPGEEKRPTLRSRPRQSRSARA